MTITIDINEKDYEIIRRSADLFIYENTSFDQLVSRVFHSVKDATIEATTKTDYMYKDLCEYRDILTKIANSLNDITHGDFLYGKWSAYSDCLAMINGIINKHAEGDR